MWDLDSLKHGLEFLDNVLKAKLDEVKKLDLDITNIIKVFNEADALKFSKNFLGEGEYYAVGIDGSMDYTVGLDVVTMFISVASYTLPFHVEEDGSINLSFDRVRKLESQSIFKVIPFWFDDLNGFTGLTELLDERSIGRSLDSIPRSIMTFSEYYFALKALEAPENKIIFLDRPIASSIGPFKRDARDVLNKLEGGVFTSLGIDGFKLGLLDLYLAIYLGPHPDFFNYEFRPGNKLHFVVQKMVSLAWRNNDLSININELMKLLPPKISKKKLINKLVKFDREHLHNALIEDVTDTSIILSKDVFEYWRRVENVLNKFIERLFGDNGKSVTHPLYVGGRPLTVKEINTLGLFLIYKLRELESKENKLVIGIGKDTSVTDMNRAVLPYLSSLGMVSVINLKGIKSDRSMYSILSTLHRDKFPVPWRSIGYDNIFSTLVFRDNHLAPARKKATQSMFLIRNYFQLREVPSLGTYIRSPIFFYDRFFREYIDGEFLREEDIHHIDKPYKSKFYLETGVNPLDNFILYILMKFDNDQIIEAAGHNYLLFIADKEVKRMIQTVRNSISTVVENALYRMIRNYDIYIITKSFREYRAQIERRRRR